MLPYGLDTETTPLTKGRSPQFKLMSIYSQIVKAVYLNADEVRKFFSSLSESSIFVSQNLAFDFEILLSLDNVFAGYKIAKINLTARPCFVSLKKSIDTKTIRRKITITFLGLENFVSGKLKDLANTFKTNPKLEADFRLPATSKLLQTYSLRDSEIVYDIYTKYFMHVGKNNRVALSIPTIAYQKLLETLPDRLYTRRSKLVKTIEQSAYYGGRNEIFNYASQYSYAYDINSMYPYAMSQIKCPVAFSYFAYQPNISRIKELVEDPNQTFIFRGRVYLTQPCLPVRIKSKLVFPVGEVEGSWGEPEIAYGLAKGWIKILSIKLLVVYRAIREYLKPFVEKYYSLRQTFMAGSPQNLLYKGYLNSSYGKFAQRQKLSMELNEKELAQPDLIEDSDYIDENGLKWSIRKVGDRWIKECRSQDEAFGKFTVIAVMITSQSRVYLMDYIFANKRETAYCDTDSCVVYKPLFDNSKELGKVKLEKEGFFTAFALKFYHIGAELKTKGIPASSSIVDNSSKSITFSFDKVLKPREAKRRHLPAYAIKASTKTVRKEYDKGYVVGNKVYPLVMLNGYILNHICDNLKTLYSNYGAMIYAVR